MTKTLLTAIAVLGLCSIGQAQQPNPQQKAPAAQSSQQSGQETSVTGCLQRGTSSGEYTLTASDGKKYDLRSSSTTVKLYDHINHRVTIKGMPQSGSEKSSTTSKAGSPEMLNVTSLTMVSTSCQ